jgi:recombination protein RecT
VLQSVFVAAVVGLEPGVLGQAYLIPYKNRNGDYICTFVPGWKGIISVIGRSAKGLARSGVVFKGDEFDYDVGTGMFIKPQAEGQGAQGRGHHARVCDRRSRRAAGPHHRGVGHRAGARTLRQVQQGRREALRPQELEMYARKVPLLQVAKYLPQTVEITNVVAAAYTAERNENLIVDENGVPVNAGFNDGEGDKKPPIMQPQRKTRRT